MTTEAIPNSNVAASMASIGYGAAFSIGSGTGPITYTQIIELTDINWSGLTISKEEKTNLGSPSATKEYLPGVVDSGTIELQGNWIGDATQTSLLTAAQSRTVFPFQIQVLVNGATKTTTVTGVGFFEKFSPVGSITVDKVVKLSAQLQITGPTVVTEV